MIVIRDLPRLLRGRGTPLRPSPLLPRRRVGRTMVRQRVVLRVYSSRNPRADRLRLLPRLLPRLHHTRALQVDQAGNSRRRHLLPPSSPLFLLMPPRSRRRRNCQLPRRRRLSVRRNRQKRNERLRRHLSSLLQCSLVEQRNKNQWRKRPGVPVRRRPKNQKGVLVRRRRNVAMVKGRDWNELTRSSLRRGVPGRSVHPPLRTVSA